MRYRDYKDILSEAPVTDLGLPESALLQLIGNID